MQQSFENLPDSIDALKQMVLQITSEKTAEEKRLNLEVKNLKHEVDHYKALAKIAQSKLFAPSSERHIHENQLGLFNEAEDLVSSNPKPSKDKSKPQKKIPKRTPIDPGIPRDETIHDVEDKQCCGKAMKSMGQVNSEQVDVIPARVIVRKHTRLKYVCGCCQKIKTAPLPKQPIPKSLAAPGLLAAIATNKYADGMPLYRQESILSRAGIQIGRATTASWMIKLSELLQPLCNLMQDELLERPVLQADETTVQVLKEKGRKAKTKSYIWVTASGRFGADPPIILFHCDPSRGAKVAERLLDGWSGYLMTDGYAGYSPVARDNGITLCACFDHVRRKFKDAINSRTEGEPAGLAEGALWYIEKLYGIERREKNCSGDRRRRARNLYSYSVMRSLRKWLDRHINLVRPSSQTGKALGYLNRQWPKLERFLECGDVPLSNELCENAIRPFVIGRKAWMFSATPGGADASCVLYSLIETAKANGHEPWAYLNYAVERIASCETAADYLALLPYSLDPTQLKLV